MVALLGFSRMIDRVSIFVGQSVSWLVLLAILVSAGNATTRKVLNLSSNAWLELQWYLFSAVFLLAAAYTLQRGEHVKIDILYGRLQRRTQVWIEIFGTIFFLMPFCLITLWITTPVALSKYASGEMSSNAGGLPMWPVWILIPVGFALLTLQGVSELIKRIAFLTGAGPDPAEGQTAQPH